MALNSEGGKAQNLDHEMVLEMALKRAPRTADQKVRWTAIKKVPSWDHEMVPCSARQKELKTVDWTVHLTELMLGKDLALQTD